MSAIALDLNVEQMRVLAGLDLTRLAKLSGVSQPTCSRLERGEVRRFRGETVQKVAVGLQQGLKARGIQKPLEEIELAIMAERDRKRVRV